jgi:hypothetical protein
MSQIILVRLLALLCLSRCSSSRGRFCHGFPSLTGHSGATFSGIVRAIGSGTLGNIRFQTLQFRTLRLAFTDAYRGSPERVFKQGKYLRRACPGECWYVIEKGVNSTSGFRQHIGIFEDIDLVIAGRVVRAFPFRKLPKMLCLWANEPPYIAGHNIKHLASQDSRG